MMTGSISATLTGLMFFVSILVVTGSFQYACAEAMVEGIDNQQLIAQWTRSDPRWQAVDDQQEKSAAAESGASAPPQRWYDRPSGVQQRPIDQPASQQSASPTEDHPWYQQQGPAATGAPPAARQPQVDIPVGRKDEAIGGGRSGGVLPDLPQRGMPGRDMGPAGTARQPPSASPLDRGIGPGAVSSGIGAGRFFQEGVIRTEEGRGKTTHFMDDGSVIEVHHAPRTGGTDTYVHWPASGSEHAGKPTTYYYDDDGNLVQESSGGGKDDSTTGDQEGQQTGTTDGQEEDELSDITLAPIPPEDDNEDEGEDSETAESRSGDPDQWHGGEAPPSRTGVGSTLRDRKPARDGRVGGETEDERESAHAPRPELDVDEQMTDRAGQVGDRRERGPGVQIRLPEDRLGDPPRGGAGTR